MKHTFSKIVFPLGSTDSFSLLTCVDEAYLVGSSSSNSCPTGSFCARFRSACRFAAHTLWDVLLLSSLALGLSACSSDHDSPDAPPTEDQMADYTVMIYMVADNSLKFFVTDDLEEMKEGMAQVSNSNVHLLLYVDTGSTPRLVELVKEKGEVKEKVIKEYASRNSCGVEEMQEVVDDLRGNKSLLAKKYGFIFWSHGEGWIPASSHINTRWIGQDLSGGGHYMDVQDLANFYAKYPKMEFVLFDACFMLSMEVAYALRDQVDYLIACPTETPGTGADYSRLVPAIMAGGEQIAVNIGKAFYEPYEEKYNGGHELSDLNWTAGASVGVVKTEVLSQLATLTRQLLANAKMAEDVYQTVFDYDKRTPTSSLYVGYFDTVQLMKQLLSASDFAQWKKLYDQAIVYWQTTPKNFSSHVGLFSMEGTNGISHFIPRANHPLAALAYQDTDWYRDAGLSQLGW